MNIEATVIIIVYINIAIHTFISLFQTVKAIKHFIRKLMKRCLTNRNKSRQISELVETSHKGYKKNKVLPIEKL